MNKSQSSASIADFIKKHYPEFWGDKVYPIDQSIYFHKKTDSHWILSNMCATPIMIYDVPFKSSEHLFQTMKFATEESALAVYQSNSPKMTAKHYQKLGGHRREDWGEMIVDAMKFCLQQKYEQSAEFRTELERSKGCFIVELQEGRRQRPNAWGVKVEDDSFKGPNMMGRLLMQLRDNGKLYYKLPDNALDFISVIRDTI